MKKIIFCALFFSLLMVFSCRKESQQNGSKAIDPLVQFTANTFNDLYLWYESMPAVDLITIKTPDDWL